MCIPPEYQQRKGSELAFHFINEVRIGAGKVEIVEGFLFPADTQAVLVAGIEKQDGAQDRALADALGADQMHVSVQPHLAVADAGAIDEYDFTELSHGLPPR